jgi:excisionase family DNA binding protein
MIEAVETIAREGLSIAEACAMAGLGRTKLYQAIADGSLQARKFGKRTSSCAVIYEHFLHLFREPHEEKENARSGGQDRSEPL